MKCMNIVHSVTVWVVLVGGKKAPRRGPTIVQKYATFSQTHIDWTKLVNSPGRDHVSRGFYLLLVLNEIAVRVILIRQIVHGSSGAANFILLQKYVVASRAKLIKVGIFLDERHLSKLFFLFLF